MKFFAKLLLVGVIALTVYSFGQRNRHSISQTPQPVESVSAPAPPVASASVDPSATVLQPLPSQKLSDPLAHTKALLRSKMRQYHESEANNPDDIEGRARLLQEMLAMVTDENVAEIIQSLSAEEMKTSFGNGALHHWMQIDPTTASNWLASRAEITEEQTLAVAEDWNKNRDGLTQYLAQLPDTAWKQSFLQAASSQMSLNDPLEAIKLAQQMKPGDAQVNLLQSVACAWVDNNPNAALDWINSVNDPSLREHLIASAAQSYALTNPDLAAAWLVSSVKSDEIVKGSTLNIAQTWVATDPAGAAKWVSQFPDGETKAAAIDIVAKHWQQTDPDSAATWIQNLTQIQNGSPNGPAQF